jgi:hypothetical protein
MVKVAAETCPPAPREETRIGKHFPQRLVTQINYLFLLFFTFTIFISCTTVPATITSRKLPIGEPQWQQFADGIDYFHGKISSPRLRFWALRIDLLSPGVEIVVRGGADSGTDSEGMFSAKVSSFVRSNNLAAGINAVPFDVSSSREGQPIKNVGIIISQGKLISPANSNYDALVFYKDGKIAVVSQEEIASASIENIKNAAGGFHQILNGGEPTERALNSEPRHPRSAAGISANGRYLYLLVIDGRQARSIGATEEETALLLSAIGSWNGINFDGGGSSALALRFPGGKVKIINMPVHKVIPGQERAVAGCLGIRIK